VQRLCSDYDDARDQKGTGVRRQFRMRSVPPIDGSDPHGQRTSVPAAVSVKIGPSGSSIAAQSQLPEQGTNVPTVAVTVAVAPVTPVAEAVTVIVPAPVA